MFKKFKRNKIHNHAVKLYKITKDHADKMADAWILTILGTGRLIDPEEYFNAVVSYSKKSIEVAIKFPKRVALLHHAFILEVNKAARLHTIKELKELIPIREDYGGTTNES